MHIQIIIFLKIDTTFNQALKIANHRFPPYSFLSNVLKIQTSNALQQLIP